MAFDKRDIVYYLSSEIKENKQGKREPHYNILLGRYTSSIGYYWYQLIGTSREIEENHENVLIIEPKDNNPFRKPTRFNCDNVYSIHQGEIKESDIKGKVEPNIFDEIKKKINQSNHIFPKIKTRLNLPKNVSN